MASDRDKSSPTERLQQLMAEVDGHGALGKVSSAAVAHEAETARLLVVFTRWALFGFLCLGLGFWLGVESARLRWSSRQPSEPQLLAAQGWRHDGTGVFYRWCQEACHEPQIYGGGVIKAFEVKCVARPCGEILMRFNILNAKGEVVNLLTLQKEGLQGETRRFLIESQHPDAASLELSDFSARAKV